MTSRGKGRRTRRTDGLQRRGRPPKRTRLTPLGRLLVLVVIMSLGAIAGAAGAAATRPHAQAWRCISVRPGETLWGIAGRNPAADRRETVQRILSENLLSAPPQAGQAIWIPNEGDLKGLSFARTSACPGDY
jgi:hypothetical protein